MSAIPGPTPPSPPPASPPRPPREQRSGCLTAFMAIAGLILLLPGLCAIVFGYGELTSAGTEPIVTFLVTIGLVLGGVGVALLRSAIRGRAP